jgi:hypothetical protein
MGGSTAGSASKTRGTPPKDDCEDRTIGLAMAIGVLLLAVGSVLGKDHGIGSAITGAIKSALQQASGGGK